MSFTDRMLKWTAVIVMAITALSAFVNSPTIWNLAGGGCLLFCAVQMGRSQVHVP